MSLAMAEEMQYQASMSVSTKPSSRISVNTNQSEDYCMFNVADMVNAILAVGDAVHVPQGSGTIQFIGPTTFAPGEWIGVVLHEPDGKNDGSVRGERYFDCLPGHGVFVRRNTCSPDDGSGDPLFEQGLASWPLAQLSSPRPDETGSRMKKKVRILHRKQDGTSSAGMMSFAGKLRDNLHQDGTSSAGMMSFAGKLTLPRHQDVVQSRDRSPRSSDETHMTEASGTSLMASDDAASISTARRKPKASVIMEDFLKQDPKKLLRGPSSEASEVAISAQLCLAEATEEQDIEKLRITLPWAASLGVAHKDLEAARQVLHFKASHVYLHEVQNIESVMNNLSRVAHATPLPQIQTETSRRSALSGKVRTPYFSQKSRPLAEEENHEAAHKSRPLAEEANREAALTVEERVVLEVRSACTAALRTACDDMRKGFAGFVRELRQDLFEIRSELNSALNGQTALQGKENKQNLEAEAMNAKKNFKTASQSSKESRQSSSPTIPYSNHIFRNARSTPSQPFPDSGAEDDTPEISEAKSEKLRAIISGGVERKEARRRQAAIFTIQRCVCNLKGRWELHADQARSWQAVANAARTRNVAIGRIFDRCRGDHYGLVKEAFLRAMSYITYSRLSVLQNAALFDGFCKGTHRRQLDFKAFNSICEAVASGDRAATDLAGLHFEEFQELAHISEP